MQDRREGQDMSAPDTKPSATLSDGVVDWLINGTRDQRFIDNIFAEMCIRLQQAGIPLKRATMHVRIQHPQWLGAGFLWSDGMLGRPVDTICGRAKGRSASGGETGERPFLYLVKEDEAYVVDGKSGSAASTAYRNICN